MNIVADSKIPKVSEAMASLGDVTLVDGRSINKQHLQDCSCLLVRTVTAVNAQLLANTSVRFVGTATIGTDHVDEDWLANQGIGFANAAGCNAEAASEYVVSGIFALSKKYGFDPRSKTAGIVGFGNVGSRLAAKLALLGFDILVNDPPLARLRDSETDYVSLDEIIERCDLISIHVPLTRSGEDATWHLFDAERLANLKAGCLLINAARGEVVDNRALSELLTTRDDLRVFLDTWENEPLVSRQLMQQVDLATPHIAGYSLEGRLRGTQMVCDAAHAHFGAEPRWNMSLLLKDAGKLNSRYESDDLDYWQTLFAQHCDIWRDHNALLAGSDLPTVDFGPHFDSLRRVYEDRREYEYFQLAGAQPEHIVNTATQLGFRANPASLLS